MGSFIRNGNYSLEANYIFKSEEELKAFYSDELNNVQLHEGLLKVVASDNGQTLYWVKKENGEYVFVPLIRDNSLSHIESNLSQWYEG